VVSKVNGIFQWVCFLLVGFMLTSCGGGGGGSGFNGSDTLKVSITADKTVLPANLLGTRPDESGSFTNTITVQVKKNDRFFAAPSVSIDIVSGLSSGALYYLDGDPAHQECRAVPPQTCPPVTPAPLAFRRLVFENTTGTVTGHFHAGDAPGKVVLRASASDPQTGETVVADLTITIGPGVSTGQPALIGFEIVPSPLYITGQGQADVKRFQVAVLDDAGQPVPNPANNNIRLQLLPNRPNGGEKLVAISASGATEEGEAVNTRTINGRAEIALHSGNKPGTVAIAAFADRADNNVDNGIENSLSDIDTIPIGSGEITSLTFTGPYPGAVKSRSNTLALSNGDSIDASGSVYTRAISVLAVDEFGNPPPPGEFITFRLIDGPMTGYPDLGRGTFTIAGKDGNPQEGGNTFTTPSSGSSLLGASTNCQLVLEGGPWQEGGWIINGQSQRNLLSIFNTFNPVADTGFTVPYTVGCPPYKGNVADNINGVTVATDADGVATTAINYPRTQLGRCFKLTAEANGGKVGAVMGIERLGSTVYGDQCTSWYLGVATGAKLVLVPASDQSFQVPVGATITDRKVTMQLVDGATPIAAPLPGEKLSVQFVITDPDKDAAIAAKVAVTAAQASVDSVNASNPASCGPVAVVGENSLCPAWRTALGAAQTALNKAKADLAAAEARDALHNPTASFKPNPLVTGVDGFAVMSVTVSDLYSAASTGGTGDAKVQFFISTVGPEILAPPVVVTILPQGAAAPAPTP
jgi:hypothetical protein